MRRAEVVSERRRADVRLRVTVDGAVRLDSSHELNRFTREPLFLRVEGLGEESLVARVEELSRTGVLRTCASLAAVHQPVDAARFA